MRAAAPQCIYKYLTDLLSFRFCIAAALGLDPDVIAALSGGFGGMFVLVLPWRKPLMPLSIAYMGKRSSTHNPAVGGLMLSVPALMVILFMQPGTMRMRRRSRRSSVPCKERSPPRRRPLPRPLLVSQVRS